MSCVSTVILLGADAHLNHHKPHFLLNVISLQNTLQGECGKHEALEHSRMF